MKRSIARIGRTLGAGLMLTVLAGCGTMTPYPFLAVIGGETMSLSTTDKTLGDHVASSITGKDCSTFEAMEKRPYCKPHGEPKDPSLDDPLCYRTLGDVDCYDREYPYPTPNQRIGS